VIDSHEIESDKLLNKGHPENFVTLGSIAGPFGIRGWVKIHSDTDPKENIFRYTDWRLSASGRTEYRRLLDGKRHGRGVVAKLSGCVDRDSAEALRGSEIAVPRDQLPGGLGIGEYYWTDLEGLSVVTVEGVDLGSVAHLFETGSNDVMVVRGDRERLIPFIWEQVVVGVDLESGRMQVDWDPGF
jgi:16S rRNA processing protein RimM